MTILEMAALIGSKGLLSMEGMKVRIIINNVKKSYGNINVLVTPVDGYGEKWVSLDRITVL